VQRQVAQVRRRLLQLGQASHADDRSHRMVPACHHQIRAALGIGNKTRDTALRGFSHAELPRVR